MATFRDVVDYWTINNLDKSNTILLLIDAFDDLGISKDSEDLKELLLRIANGYAYVSEDEARIIVNLFEKYVSNKNYLKTIACILAGENLSNDYSTLETIMFKHSWSIAEDINVFICWYYRLCSNKVYYNWVIRSFLILKLLMFLKTICLIFGILFTTHVLTRFSIQLCMYFVPGIADLFIVLATTIGLVVGLMIVFMSLYKYKFMLLLRFDISFKKYIV